jgi:hypothetical protein
MFSPQLLLPEKEANFKFTEYQNQGLLHTYMQLYGIDDVAVMGCDAVQTPDNMRLRNIGIYLHASLLDVTTQQNNTVILTA